MENPQIIALVAIAISVISAGLVIANIFISHNTVADLKTNVVEQSHTIQSLNQQQVATQQVIDDQKRSLMKMQDDIANLSSEIKSLEDKVASLEQRLPQRCDLPGGCLPPNPNPPQFPFPIPSFNGKTIWYGVSVQAQDALDAADRLKATGMHVEKRQRPVSNLGNADLVIIGPTDYLKPFSQSEVDELKNYVNHGGHLILTIDTDYYYCNPASLCSMEVARNFGFAFNGDVSGTIIPAPGQASNALWTAPHQISSFSDWCCDGYISEILDPAHVKVLGILEGSNGGIYSKGTIAVQQQPAIVVNDNPDYQGGEVMGIGQNMFIGSNGDYTMFDNVINYMISRSLPK